MLGLHGTPPIPPSWLPPFWVSTLQALASRVPFATGLTTAKPSALYMWYNNHCTRSQLTVLPLSSECHRGSAFPGTVASVHFPLCHAHGGICAHLVTAPTTEPGTVATPPLTPASVDGPQGRPDHPHIHLFTPPVVEPFSRLGLLSSLLFRIFIYYYASLCEITRHYVLFCSLD